jgi:hypothetical protein
VVYIYSERTLSPRFYRLGKIVCLEQVPLCSDPSALLGRAFRWISPESLVAVSPSWHPNHPCRDPRGMHMGGLVRLNGVEVYGFLVVDEGEFRVRISTDEWERSGLHIGQRVRLEAPGRDGNFLLTSATEAPPVVWIRFRPLVSRVVG